MKLHPLKISSLYLFACTASAGWQSETNKDYLFLYQNNDRVHQNMVTQISREQCNKFSLIRLQRSRH